ncbi:MAG: adenosylcobinamide-GDP ribazoletransferase [Thalassotalea sp.]
MINTLQYQYKLWLIALSFFTRIPVNITGNIETAMFHQASRYFALVGVLVGSLLAIFFYLAQLVFPVEITVILTLGLNLVLTGAFHEDGWADIWDGFGGGWEVEQKLNIMKDSRLGTYGAAALFIALLLKYQSLLALADFLPVLLFALVLANTLSRAVATSLILTMNYVSEDAKSKVKPVTKELSISSLLLLIITSLSVLVLGLVLNLYSVTTAVSVIISLLVIRFILQKWFYAQLKGYTGDCLGAAQICTEIVVYLVLIAAFIGVN